MSRRLSENEFLIEPEPNGTCELCGKVAELRPYGPNGENICYTCGMKDEGITTKKFKERLGNPSSIMIRRTQ